MFLGDLSLSDSTIAVKPDATYLPTGRNGRRRLGWAVFYKSV